MALELNIQATLPDFLRFTPSIIFIQSSQFLNKIGSLLQVYYTNFLFQLSKSRIDWENWVFLLFKQLEPNFSFLKNEIFVAVFKALWVVKKGLKLTKWSSLICLALSVLKKVSQAVMNFEWSGWKSRFS